MSELKRLFVDMDGTLAEWRSFKYEFTSFEEAQNASKLIYEKLNEKNYFFTLKPNNNVVAAVKKIIAEHSNDIEVFILSAVISDTAKADKNRWLDRYLPEIDSAHRIFTPDGKDKKEFVPGKIRADDYLLDDRTLNLLDWEPPAKGIKLLNGLNHSNGTWKSSALNFKKDYALLAENIADIVKSGKQIIDKKPNVYTQTVEIKKNTAVSQYIKIINDNAFKAFSWSASQGTHITFERCNNGWRLVHSTVAGNVLAETQYSDKKTALNDLSKNYGDVTIHAVFEVGEQEIEEKEQAKLNKEAVVRFNGDYWFIGDKYDYPKVLEPFNDDYNNIYTKEDYIKYVSKRNPDYADYINSHILEMLKEIEDIENMISEESVEVERDKLLMELGPGGGYGESMANMEAEKRLSNLCDLVKSFQTAQHGCCDMSAEEEMEQ